MAEYKTILLGSPRVGKTALFNAIKIIENEGSDDEGPISLGSARRSTITTPSTAFDSCSKAVELDSGETVKLTFFDTMGQERFNSVPNQYYRKARFILLVFNYANEQSLRDLHDLDDYLRSQLSTNTLSYALCLVGVSSGESYEDRPSYDMGIVTEEMVKEFCSFHAISKDLTFVVEFGKRSSMIRLLHQLALASRKLMRHHGLVSSFQLSADYSTHSSVKQSPGSGHHLGKQSDAHTQTDKSSGCICWR